MITFDVIGFLLSWFTFFSIYAILSMSLNLEVGYAGMANFGKVAFYGIGAYVSAYVSMSIFLSLAGLNYPLYSLEATMAMVKLASQNPMLNVSVFILTLILAFLIAGAIGYVIMYPTLRVGPAFFGITVLSFGELLRIFLRHYEPTGATYGLTGIPHPFAWIEDVFVKNLLFTSVTLIILILLFLYAQRLVNSPLGRTMLAIREDEIAALCMGKDVPKVKGKVLFIGSGMAGIAGCILAYYIGSINPNIFVPTVTFDVWAMMILGGIGNNKGAIVGAGIITLVDRATAAINFVFPGLIIDPNFIRWMIIGLIIILVLLFKPAGLIPQTYTWTPAWKIVKPLEEKAKRRREKLLSPFKKISKWFLMGG